MDIKIVEWNDSFAQDYITLSVEWLEKYVRVEPADEEILYHPHEAVRQPAIHLYRKCGFVEVPLIDNEYEESDMKMELQLQEV